MRMVPPLRGVWASAVGASPTPNPATIAIFLSIILSPTVQEYSDQRVDHLQRVKRKLLIMAIGTNTCAASARGVGLPWKAAGVAPSGRGCRRRADQDACQLKRTGA